MRMALRLVPVEVWLILTALLLGLTVHGIPSGLEHQVVMLPTHCLWFSQPGTPNVCV